MSIDSIKRFMNSHSYIKHSTKCFTSKHVFNDWKKTLKNLHFSKSHTCTHTNVATSYNSICWPKNFLKSMKHQFNWNNTWNIENIEYLFQNWSNNNNNRHMNSWWVEIENTIRWNSNLNANEDQKLRMLKSAEKQMQRSK